VCLTYLRTVEIAMDSPLQSLEEWASSGHLISLILSHLFLQYHSKKNYCYQFKIWYFITIL